MKSQPEIPFAMVLIEEDGGEGRGEIGKVLRKTFKLRIH